MRRQIKRVVATLLTASLIVPMCYGNKVSNAEMVKKNVTATAAVSYTHLTLPTNPRV